MGRKVVSLTVLAGATIGTEGFVATPSRPLLKTVERNRASLQAVDSFGNRVEAGLLTLFEPKEVKVASSVIYLRHLSLSDYARFAPRRCSVILHAGILVVAFLLLTIHLFHVAMKVSRVVDAWRAMRRGDELKRPVPLAGGKSAADAVADAADGDGHPLLVQECNSWLKGLEPVQCFYDEESRPTSKDAAGSAAMAQWTSALEAAWPQVQAEFLSVIGDQVWVEASSIVG